MTQAPSHRTSTGQTREQLKPKMFESRIVNAEPRTFPLTIFLMKPGTSICVGQADVQGASKQLRHLAASMAADCGAKGGCRSAKRWANSSRVNCNFMP